MLSSRSRNYQNGGGSADFPESLPFRFRTGQTGQTSTTGKNVSASYNSQERLMHRIWWLCGICLIMVIYGGVFRWDPVELKEHEKRDSGGAENHLTVMINTFKRPPGVVEDAIEHYKQCHVVKYVYVVWSDREHPPPPSM